jgi:hypothetical protein
MVLIIFSMLVGVLISVTGWAIMDRLHWQTNEATIQLNCARIQKLEDRTSQLPPKVASEDQVLSLEQQEAKDNQQVVNMLQNIGTRIDALVEAGKIGRNKGARYEEPPLATQHEP